LEFNSNRNFFTQQGLNLNGFGKGLLASLIYEVSGKKHKELIGLKWKMELN
jgi:hypothetical protein